MYLHYNIESLTTKQQKNLSKNPSPSYILSGCELLNSWRKLCFSLLWSVLGLHSLANNLHNLATARSTDCHQMGRDALD